MPKKLLLDESVPRPLSASTSPQFDVLTAQEMGWAGSQNGRLMQLAAEHGFDALLTVDQGFEYEQNLGTLPIPVIVLFAVRNRLQELRSLVPQVIALLHRILRRRVYRNSPQQSR